ncbi:uracil-DNA glycosylase [Alcanivorax sp. 1008]|uniref:uracil-DNA glycosylase n=1 Tax=Alcanivorax sp. 1008 TaxID=2816853 RepID=UPI001D802CF3|nr:uracil-DNA glycosylase [Alcanivorax sp. 1008]MCC1497636.1 uracil-DNA glycosylase [Alcanivorax sp. 1008]
MTESSDWAGLEAGWKQVLAGELSSDYMTHLRAFLRAEKQQGKEIYPPSSLIFNAFEHTPFDQVKVVILGQDPYHGPGQAHGLCFSVPEGTRPPPSLVNIFKEIERDLAKPASKNGNLEHWADQGVLLLNATLTVEKGLAGSHQRKGWERFTDAVIDRLNRERDGIVFMLWGSYAQKKGALIDRDRHLVLTAPHPSPLSAHRGFLGCGHFSKANEYLVAQDKMPVDWAPQGSW